MTWVLAAAPDCPLETPISGCVYGTDEYMSPLFGVVVVGALVLLALLLLCSALAIIFFGGREAVQLNTPSARRHRKRFTDATGEVAQREARIAELQGERMLYVEVSRFNTGRENLSDDERYLSRADAERKAEVLHFEIVGLKHEIRHLRAGVPFRSRSKPSSAEI